MKNRTPRRMHLGSVTAVTLVAGLCAAQAAFGPDSRLNGTILGKSLKFGNRVESLATYKFLTITMLS